MSDLALLKKDTVDVVTKKIAEFKNTGEIKFPETYCPENALKSAWLILQEVETKDKKKALDVCSKDSIANTLLDMVIQGLSPAKKQCYFIPYGSQLQLQRSYFGTLAITKRLKEIKDIRSQVIFEDDELEITIEDGSRKITKHIQKLQNIDTNKIIGAYTIIEKTDETIYTEIMSMAQIMQAWRQSKMYPMDGDKIKETSVHGKFTDQMALKTVINRACKNFANTSDDSDILIESFNRTTENEYKGEKDVKRDISQEIEENANKEEIDFKEEVVNEVIEGDFVVKEDEEPSRGF